MPQYFTLAQAEKLLPQVERLLRDALFHKAEYQRASDEIAAVADRIRFSGGAHVDPVAVKAKRSQRDHSVDALKRAMEEIEQIGAQVKDLDIGLIDFPTVYQNREVCLCWKLGEDGIRFWHGSDEGFRGRKPIDAEFLSNHRGEPAN